MTVRTALFAYLDELLSGSEDETLGWQQTGSFEFNSKIFTIRQTRGRGICKPSGLVRLFQSRPRSHDLDRNLHTRISLAKMVIHVINTNGPTRTYIRTEHFDFVWNMDFRLCIS